MINRTINAKDKTRDARGHCF